MNPLFLLLLVLYVTNVAYADINSFCAKNTKKTKYGIQFDGKKANIEVMKLMAGTYEYPNQGMLIIFLNDYFLLQLPKNRKNIYGTDGSDLITSEGMIGGCSKEQLSELIQNNKLKIKLLSLIYSYNNKYEENNKNLEIELNILFKEAAIKTNKKEFVSEAWVKKLKNGYKNLPLLNLDLKIIKKKQDKIMYDQQLGKNNIDDIIKLSYLDVRMSINQFRRNKINKVKQYLNRSKKTLSLLSKYKNGDEIELYKKKLDLILLDDLVSDSIKNGNNFSLISNLLKNNLIGDVVTYQYITNKLLAKDHYYQAVKISIDILQAVHANKNQRLYWENITEGILGSLFLNISWKSPSYVINYNTKEYVHRYNDPDDFYSPVELKKGEKIYGMTNSEEDRVEVFTGWLSCKRNIECRFYKTIEKRMKEYNIELILKYYYLIKFYLKWPSFCLRESEFIKKLQIYLEKYEATVPSGFSTSNSNSILKGFLYSNNYMMKNGCKILDNNM